MNAQFSDYMRKQFPALKTMVAGQPAAFLDGPGGYQVPQRVIDAVADYYTSMNANAGGAFLTSNRNDAMLEAARRVFADFFNCHPEEVVFGANMTTLNFLLSQALAREMDVGDRVIITAMDHEANRSPWLQLQERGISVEDVALDVSTCTLDMDDFRAKLAQPARVVALNYAQNAVGTISDVQALVSAAHAAGAYTVVDAVHYAAHGSIDVKKLDTDFLICSAYKFFGPHVGVMYAKKEILSRLKPLRVKTQKAHPPYMLETGTLNHEGIAGAVEAVAFIADIGAKFSPAEKIQPQLAGLQGRRRNIAAGLLVFDAYEQQLTSYLVDALAAIPQITLYGPPKGHPRTSTVSFTWAERPAAEVAQHLGRRGLFVWDGDFYAAALVDSLGLRKQGGLVRIGIAPYNTRAELDRVVAALQVDAFSK